MTDFFDDLERQLVDAAPQRRARLRRARARRAAAVVSILVALLAGGAGIAAAVGGDAAGPERHGAPAATTAPGDHVARTPPTTPPPPGPEPYSYEVAVLNGTAIPGLARAVGNRLMQREIRVGQTTNAPAQDHVETQVFYRSEDCLPAANQVAAVLGLGAGGGEFSLRPITKAQTALVGEGPAVVVVVGSDQDVTRRP